MKATIPLLFTGIILFSGSCRYKEPSTIHSYIYLARSIEDSLNAGNADWFDRQFDWSGHEGASGYSDDNYRQLIEALQLGNDIANNIHANDGLFNYIRHYQDNNGHHLLFRLYSGHGLNYYDFEIDSNTHKITDAYIFLTGEKLSETIARMALMDALTDSLEQSGHLSGEAAAYRQAYQRIHEINALTQSEEFSEALALYDSIHPEIRKEKPFQITHLMLSARVEGSLEPAVKTYLDLYPADPSAYLIMMDIYYNREQFADALNMVEELDRLIGGDPLLYLYRGEFNLNMANPELALSHFKTLHKAYPHFESGNWALVMAYLSRGASAEALSLLKDMQKRFQLLPEDIFMMLVDYPEFLESAMYQNWLDQLQATDL